MKRSAPSTAKGKPTVAAWLKRILTIVGIAVLGALGVILLLGLVPLHSTARLVELWRQAGTQVVTFEFEPAQEIPHNSVDPAADAVKKQLVYGELLKLLGEEEIQIQ